MRGTRIYATGEQAERLIDELGGSAAEYPVYSKWFTGEQMERAIAAAGGDTAEHPVFSKYATGEQMERLIAALGGDPAEHPVQSKYATAEQAERLILALGGEPAEYPVESKYMTAEQMERLIPLAGGDPLTTFGPDALVQFTAKKAKAMSEIVVDIEPVQDLHGYDYPWPAGGNKNLVPDGTDTSNGYVANAYLAADGTTVSDTALYVSEYFPVTAGSSYTIQRSSGGANAPCIGWYDSDKTLISTVQYANQLPKTVTAPEGAAYCRASQYKSGFIQMELGSSATTPVPYSNVCPINGFTGATIYDAGANLIDWEHPFKTGGIYYGSAIGTTIAAGTSTYVTVSLSENELSVTTTASWNGATWKSLGLAPGKYKLTWSYSEPAWTGSSDAMDVFIVNKDNKIVRSITHYSVSGNYSLAITISDEEIGCSIVISIGGRSSTYGTYKLTNPMLNVGEDTEDYAPYVGTVLPVSWPDEAGTVYGGTLTINEDGSAELKVTLKQIDLGDQSWSYYSTNTYFRTDAFTDVDTSNRLYGFCSAYKVGAIAGSDDKIICFASNTFRLTCRDTTYGNSYANFKTAVKGVKFIYKLKTPVTYHFTDVGQISTVVGLNNVWADTGDVTVTAYGSAIVEPDEEPGRALNLLLGNSYTRTGDDPTDEEALDIILGGNTR